MNQPKHLGADSKVMICQDFVVYSSHQTLQLNYGASITSLPIPYCGLSNVSRKRKNAEWIGQFLAIKCHIISSWATDIQNSIPISLFRVVVLHHVFPIYKFPQCRAIGECWQIPSTSKLQDTVYGFYCTAIYSQGTDEAFSIRWHFVKEPIAKDQEAMNNWAEEIPGLQDKI